MNRVARKQGHPARANRRNRRNEKITQDLVRDLLVDACETLDEYGIEMSPRLAGWWERRRRISTEMKQRESEGGMLAVIREEWGMGVSEVAEEFEGPAPKGKRGEQKII